MKTTSRPSSNRLPTFWSLAAAFGTALSSLTAAPPVIHEPFAQTAGAINGKAASTTGLTGNWTATTGASAVNVVTPSSMVFGGLAMSNGHANLLRSGNTNGRVVRSTALADAGLLANDAELWFSLVIMKTNGGGNNEWSGFAFGTSHLTSGPGSLTLQGGNGLGFRTRDTAVTVGTWNGTTTPAVGGSLTLTYNVPSLIVGKIEWGATDSDVETITLYKPTPDLSSLGTGVSKTMAAVDQSLFTTISYSLRDVDTMNYDEIRFGATQADVMPVDTVAPTLLSITDNMAGGPIGEDVAAVTYTLTFDKHMDLSTITAADFDNAGSATATVGTVAQVSQTVITVQLLPTSTGTLQLRIPSLSVLSSFVPLNLDTTSDILDDAIIINTGTTSPNTPTANRWWDGSTLSGITNGASGGGAGTWSTTNTNWDRGAGFEAPVAWNNSDGNTAIFGGTTGTGIVTLDGNITLDGLIVNLPNATGSVYSIGNVGEDNTLTFTGAKLVTTTATGTGTNQDVIIRAGISGSPTMNIAGRLANSVDQFSLLPGSAVTQTIGTLNMLNTNASNKRLILGGASTGNVVDTVAWATTANQLMLTKAGTGSWTINNNVLGNGKNGRLYVEQGTLTLGGTSNFFTHKVGVSTVRETVFTASGTASKLIAKGTFTIGDSREFFYVQNLGTLSPGPGVETLNITWNADSSTNTNDGTFNMQTGSTYEWDIASSTSTDKINVTSGVSNIANLILGNMTIKVNDAGVTTPIDAGDQLPVFTYETGAQLVRSIGTITIDTSALGAGWSGTPSLVDNGTGTIYITGLTFSAGTPSVTLTGAPIAAVDTTYGTASPTPTSFTISGADLTGAPDNLTVAPPAGYEVSLSSGSGYTTSLSVPYASATLSATTVYLRLAATATVLGSPYSGDISVSGGGLVSPATLATVSSSVSKASPTVTVTVGSYTYSGAAQGPTGFTTSPTGDTGTPTWEYVGTGLTTYGPSATLPTNAGTYTAAVSLAADDNFNAASSIATAFTINKADQTINFTLSSPVDRSAGTVALSATATSGLTVSFASSAPTIASVSGSTLTLLQGGSITVTASQAGDDNYNPAPAVPQPLIITGYTAVADAATRPTNSPSIKIPVATLLANDGAVDSGGAVTPGTGLTLTGVTAGTGNTVTFDATWVYYTPTTPANSDPLTFTYTSSNGADSATATVTVTTVASAPFTLDIIRRVTAAAYDAMANTTSVTVEFAGVPNQTYEIQYSTDMETWSTAVGYPTGATGTFNATFTAAGNQESAWSSLFFRANR